MSSPASSSRSLAPAHSFLMRGSYFFSMASMASLLPDWAFSMRALSISFSFSIVFLSGMPFVFPRLDKAYRNWK